ncbi:ATP-binding cassette domain-containing protein [Haliovirga abyssi]|uniref:ABC transporter ATP-binding protein n=1 Tax=Haliovirga abyssi TaxID=2996794 RepID=A0AAU9D3M9_9FUSO|nr:ATP-binding cassette domain-containing protein [Haliovirga abyssi]BDU50576.1 ABC transporter ATP-binding protein [Haliovirga abyssi]
MLKVRNMHVFRGEKEILQDINLHFEKGKIYSILGSNGAGKSTLARTLIGFEKIEKGSIILNSKDITKFSITERAKAGMTIALQEPARFEGMSVKDYLTLGGRFSGDNLKDIFELVGLEYKKYIYRNVDDSLSGGERKRVELASVLMMNPKIAIFDEPDSGIDALSIPNIVNILNYIKNKGNTAIVITHNEDIAAIVDYAYLICDKTIKKTGKPLEISNYFKRTCTNCDFKPGEYSDKVRIEERSQKND